jgi:hypothetical protein
MVVDGSTKKFGLLVGKGDRHGLGFDFSGPAPVATDSEVWVAYDRSAKGLFRRFSLSCLEEYCAQNEMSLIEIGFTPNGLLEHFPGFLASAKFRRMWPNLS